MTQSETVIEWRSGSSEEVLGFIGLNAVFQILPEPFRAPQEWVVYDERSERIGSFRSPAEAKVWCHERYRQLRARSASAAVGRKIG